MYSHDKYKSNSFNLVTNNQKMVLIFNGIIKILNNAVKCVETNNFEGKNVNLQTVTDVFYNLRAEIDFENGGEFAKYLDAFFYSNCRKIESANMRLNVTDDLKNIIVAVSQIKELFK